MRKLPPAVYIQAEPEQAHWDEHELSVAYFFWCRELERTKALDLLLSTSRDADELAAQATKAAYNFLVDHFHAYAPRTEQQRSRLAAQVRHALRGGPFEATPESSPRLLWWRSAKADEGAGYSTKSVSELTGILHNKSDAELRLRQDRDPFAERANEPITQGDLAQALGYLLDRAGGAVLQADLINAVCARCALTTAADPSADVAEHQAPGDEIGDLIQRVAREQFAPLAAAAFSSLTMPHRRLVATLIEEDGNLRRAATRMDRSRSAVRTAREALDRQMHEHFYSKTGRRLSKEEASSMWQALIAMLLTDD